MAIKTENQKGAEGGEVSDTEMADAPVHKASDSTSEEGKKDDTEKSAGAKGDRDNEKPNVTLERQSDATAMSRVTSSSREPDRTGTAKSEISSRSATPARPGDTVVSQTNPANIPRRPEPVRASPNTAGLRPTTLPNKPERPDSRAMRPSDPHFPSRPLATVDSSRDYRDPRPQDYSRQPGMPERSHQAAADRISGPSYRAAERHANDRASERGDIDRGHDRNFSSRVVPGDRPSRPLARERGPGSGPAMWDAERSNRARGAPEAPRARQSDLRDSQDPSIPPSRSQPSSQNDGSLINNDRTVLINGASDSRPGMSIRGQGEERSSRTSRPSSPRPSEDRRAPNRPDLLDRDSRGTERPFPRGNEQSQRHRMEGPNMSSTRDQWSDRASGTSDHISRDSRHPAMPQSASLNPPSRAAQEARYSARQPDHVSDRSPPQSLDVPSGPRTRNALLARSRNPPPLSHLSTQTPQPSGPAPASAANERQTPTGPSTRSHMRSISYHEQSTPAPSEHTTSSLDTSGVHPDRLKQIQPLPSESQPRATSFSSRAPPGIGLTSPPSAPAGPRGNPPPGAPSGPSPTNRGPPPGPHMGNDDAMRGTRNNRNPLAAVNSTLQQAGQGTSIHSRGGRNSGPISPHVGLNSPAAGPGQGVRSEVSFPSHQYNGQPDLSSGRPTELSGQGSSSSQRNGQRSAPQRHTSQRGDITSKPLPSGRRADLIDDNRSGRTSSRHSSTGRHSPERDGERRSDRDDGNRDRDNQRNDRDYGRDRDRGRDREGARDRRIEGAERHRESSSRQDDTASLQMRRSGRGRDGESETSGIPPPPTPPPPMQGQDGRGDGRGAGYRSGPGPRPGSMSGGYDTRDDRTRTGAREDDLPPRKHPRMEEAGPYSGGSTGRGGLRVGSENKRPRRGP